MKHKKNNNKPRNFVPALQIEITIGVVTNRPKFNEWLSHQLSKQTSYLDRKNVTYEVIIATENEEQQTFFINGTNYTILKTPAINVGAKRNSICSIAKGKFIGFLDDDDYYPEYRLHFQWLQFFYHPTMEVSVVDRFLCYARPESIFLEGRKGHTFYVGTLSESSLFFRKEYYEKGHKFGPGVIGEGNIFINEKTKVIVEPVVELMVAITHDNNLCNRILDEANGDLLYCQGFPFPLDPKERLLLSEIYGGD